MDLNDYLKYKILNFLPNKYCKCCRNNLGKLKSSSFCSIYCELIFKFGTIESTIILIILISIVIGPMNLLKIYISLLFTLGLQTLFI